MFGKKRLLQDNADLLKENKALRGRILSITAAYDNAEKKIKELQSSPYRPIFGITDSELNAYGEKLSILYDENVKAHKRPTEYGKGLKAALDMLEELPVRELN